MEKSSKIFNRRSEYSLWSISKAFLILTWIIIDPTESVPTNLTGGKVQPAGSELSNTCGSVCKYDEYFKRARCDDRGLTFVPSCTGCVGVKLLELQKNNINTIPPERIAEFYHVNTVDVSRNQISVLDRGTFLQLNHLMNIFLSHNHLEIVPNGVFNGTEGNLKRIYLNHNNIRIIGTRAFQSLARVILIDLRNNLIQNLPAGVFRDVKNIQSINLDNNELKYLNQDQFKGLTIMSSLSLQSNQIKILSPGLFSGLESLKEVLLSNNHLKAIPAPQILGLHFGVEVLNISNNYLNSSAVIFPFLENTNWTLYLSGNPFVCDCDFRMLQDRLNATDTQKAVIMSSETPLTCEFKDGSKYNITDFLPHICVNATGSRDIDIGSNRSKSLTVKPVTINQSGLSALTETNHSWLSILTFTELTLFFIMWLLRRFYKHCKKGIIKKWWRSRKSPRNNSSRVPIVRVLDATESRSPQE